MSWQRPLSLKKTVVCTPDVIQALRPAWKRPQSVALPVLNARRRRRRLDEPGQRDTESAMLRMRNKYCSNCLCTQRFHDLGTHLVCERCTKRLERIVPWVERVETRREAM